MYFSGQSLLTYYRKFCKGALQQAVYSSLLSAKTHHVHRQLAQRQEQEHATAASSAGDRAVAHLVLAAPAADGAGVWSLALCVQYTGACTGRLSAILRLLSLHQE